MSGGVSLPWSSTICTISAPLVRQHRARRRCPSAGGTYSVSEERVRLRDVTAKAEASETRIRIQLKNVALARHVRVPEQVVLHEREHARARGAGLQAGVANELSEREPTAGEKRVGYALQSNCEKGMESALRLEDARRRGGRSGRGRSVRRDWPSWHPPSVRDRVRGRADKIQDSSRLDFQNAEFSQEREGLNFFLRARSQSRCPGVSLEGCQRMLVLPPQHSRMLRPAVLPQHSPQPLHTYPSTSK
jgi:hypothetical protein